MRTPLIMGNWKMNGSCSGNKALLDGVLDGMKNDPIEVSVCPPALFICDVLAHVDGKISVGAQDVSLHDQGAYTGEISAVMLKDMGCQYALVGHSERRQYHGETDHSVALKAQKLLDQGLVPVICIGESLEQRESGRTEAVITQQLDAIFSVLGAQSALDIVIAYEPLWAIGTGLAATDEQVQAVHSLIRENLQGRSESLAQSTRILYGGSLKPANAGILLALKDVDGGLIGGAALKPEDFLAICRAA